MAYNDDSVLARLSALNESHDSIATAAQWIMFHRRHAERTVNLWMQRLKDSSSSKRLVLIYLANEVAQQSKIRHKDDFIIAFSPVIAEAVSSAYKGATADVQAKLKRVVDVWRDRAIFEAPIQGAIDTRIEDLDKSRGTAKPGFGISPFGASTQTPPEYASLISTHQNVSKLNAPLKTMLKSAIQEYEKQIDTSTPPPSAPVYAARLNGLLKTLANAENAVAQCVKAREGLVSALEKLLDIQQAALEIEKKDSADLLRRKIEIEDKKQQVEVGIMRALDPAEHNGPSGEGGSISPPAEPDRPEMEALTPPVMEALTPPPGDDGSFTPPAHVYDSGPIAEAATNSGDGSSGRLEVVPNLTSYQSLPISTNGSNKRRRVEDPNEFPDLGADDGLDADVAEMLKEGEKERGH